MTHPASNETKPADRDGAERMPYVADRGWAYSDFIVSRIAIDRLSLRVLADRTRIARARLGRILHRDRSKRQEMTLIELHALFHAIAIDPVEAMLAVEVAGLGGFADDGRFVNVGVMLCTMIRGLPQLLMSALEDSDLDGSEIRREWGTYFQRAVVNRTVQEVNRVLERRASLASSADPFSF